MSHAVVMATAYIAEYVVVKAVFSSGVGRAGSCIDQGDTPTAVPRRRRQRDEVDDIVFHLEHRHVVAAHHRQTRRVALPIGRRAAAEDDVRLAEFAPNN